MDEVTHKRSATTSAWAACGASTQKFVDNPTCLWCVTNTWVNDDSEIARIITMNSVKDMQETEDKKLCEHLLRNVVSDSS